MTFLSACLYLYLCINTVVSQTRNESRFSEQAMDSIHNFQAKWLEPSKLQSFTEAQDDFFNSLTQKNENNHCVNMVKTCSSFEIFGYRVAFCSNKQTENADSADTSACTTSRTRKEYRQMTKPEKKNFHKALNVMKSSLINGTSEYDLFVRHHNSVNAPGAYLGAAFLPWHREFLLRFENALRKHIPNAFLPYWDSTLDHYLPDPKDSIIWSSALMGRTTGPMTKGTLTGWKVLPECSTINGLQSTFLTRNADFKDSELLIEDSDIRYTLSKKSFQEIYDDDSEQRLEVYHAGPHVWLGGHMANLKCSPSDPMFWLHHAFIDCIWEKFRKNQTTPLLDYGNGNNTINQTADDPMLPFAPLKNKDGLQSHYTKCNYNCAERPISCKKDKDCGNKRYLWCNHGRCMSKISYGGNCSELPDSACYKKSICLEGMCQKARKKTKH